MPHILLVNPSKRKPRRKTSTRKKPVKKRRTAAQKAATRKLVALNRRKSNPVRRRTSKKPVRRRTARRAAPKKYRRKSARRRANPALTTRSIRNQVMDAGIGAGGALALDVVQGYLPIPANLKAGIVGTLVKAGLAIGIGIVGSKIKIVSNATAGKMANGALTVVLHNELKKQVQTYAPGIQMGEYIDGNGMGMYEGAGYAPYQDAAMGGMFLPTMDSGISLSDDNFGMGEYIGDSADDMDDMSY